MLPKPPVHRVEQREVLRDRVRFAKVTIAWVTPALYKAGDAELDLLSLVLSGGKSSRLYKSLVYDQKLVQESVHAYQRSAQAASMFVLSALASGKHGAAEVEKGLLAVLAEVAEKGVTAAELQRAKTVMETRMWRGLQGLNARANLLQGYKLFAGRVNYLGRDLARYRKLRPADLKRTAKQLMARKGRVVIHVLPKKVRARPAKGGNQ